MSRLSLRRGFTLLEVMVALGILALSLMVMIEMQSTSVLLSSDADRISKATVLADEKMREVLLVLEREGWSTQDIAEQGDFSDFGDEEFRGESLQLESDEDLSDYSWAYTVRAVDLNLPKGGVEDMATNMLQGGATAQTAEQQDTIGIPDMGDLGLDAAMMGEYIQDYVREIRVIVWWGDNEDEQDQIELVHHAINPTGVVQNPEAQGGT